MEATLIIRCHCGDNYAVVCPSCKESPKREINDKGTLDALRQLVDHYDRHMGRVVGWGGETTKLFVAARAILDAAGEGKPDATT